MSTSDGTVLGMTQIAGSAPRNRAFNIVLLAEGFRSTEQGQFDAACTAFLATFFATAPFDELRPAINVFRVNVTSTDSGADDPAATGGTGATARTYFDATFGGNGIRRLLLVNQATALTVAAAQVPEFTVALVIVNSTIYGGAGGSVATYSLAASATEIAIHELGHTAFGLADEYPCYACSATETDRDRHPGPEPREPNVTTNTNRATLKWNWAVAAATAVPTMSNPNCGEVDTRPSPVPAGTVGTFEGAHYFHCGGHRPEFDCKMRNLGVPFCRVCRAAIWNRIGPLAALAARPRTPIGVIARYPEHLDVFAADDNGRTMSNWWNPSSGWAGWFHVMGGVASATSPGGAGSPITAIHRYSGHIDVFTVGTDNRVYSSWWNASGGWAPWFAIGTLRCRPGSTVTALARYSDHIDLFTTAADGKVMSTWWDSRSGWADWFHLQGGFAAAGATVTAVARYPHHLDVFTVGTDNRVHSVWWDERSGWSGWFPVGTQRARSDATVTVVARHRDQLDLFTTAPDGKIVSTWWNVNGGWGTWFQVRGGVASAGSSVTAIARYSGQLDLFTIGTDRRVYSTWWSEDSGWAAWFVVSGGVGQAGGHVAAISRFAEHIDLFTVGSDGKVWSTWWHGGTGWAGWFQLGVT